MLSYQAVFSNSTEAKTQNKKYNISRTKRAFDMK